MLNVFRPSFEVVKEGRIWKKIKNLQRQFVGVNIWCQDLDKNGCFDRKNELEIGLPLREQYQINIEEV